MITTTGLTKRYGGATAVDGPTFGETRNHHRVPRTQRCRRIHPLVGGGFFRVALPGDELAEGVVDDLVEFTLRGVTAT